MSEILSYADIQEDYKTSWEIPYTTLLQLSEWMECREIILTRDNNMCTVCKKIKSKKVGATYYKILNDEEITASIKDLVIDLTGTGDPEFIIKTKTPPILEEPTEHPTILHVHHQYYFFAYLPWEYPDALITVCHECHIEIHKTAKIPVYVDESRKEQIPLTPCTKCNGVGFLHEYYYYQNGICFRCNGRKFEEFIS